MQVEEESHGALWQLDITYKVQGTVKRPFSLKK
jgi:hypothetical protein